MSSVQNKEILIKIGPRGELYSPCEDWEEILRGEIKHIVVTHGKAINSIQMAYDFNGATALSQRHGRTGETSDCMSFEASEGLVAVSGHYGPVDETYFPAIRSLKFVTDRATYGPFGVEQGTPFCFKFDSKVAFAGFLGRSSLGYLRALGVYVKSNAKTHFKPCPC